MSASLVGSEMCIRDRSWAAPARRDGRPGDTTPRFRSSCGGWFAGPWTACLLYTSDAADDM
eukprot:2849185-Alexandrium_andersonii.AAC.1